MKVLIADDEDYTREGLIETVDWEKFDVNEIMQAVNGAEAVRIVQWFKPDIVISDIRMPQMNGIEFAEKLTNMNPESRIIFISGYMEIDYLKSAIRLAAVDFIEKPIDMQALDRALEKAAGEIRRINRGKEQEEEKKLLHQQKFFRILTEKDADERTLENMLRETGHEGKSEYFQCVVAIFRKEAGRGTGYIKQMEEMLFSSGYLLASNYNADKLQYEFILSYKEKDKYRIMPFYQRLLELLPGLCIGVGIEAGNYRNIYNSYRTAAMAINCAFYQKDGKFFTIDESITQKGFINPGIYAEFLQVMSKPVPKMKEWCIEMFEKFGSYKYYRKEQVYILMSSLLNALFHKYPYLYREYSEISDEDAVVAHIQSLGTLYEIQELFMQVISCIEAHQQEQFGYSRVVCGAQDYIERHYSEESLSMAEIAEQLHLSPSYLNVLFKQETKVTLKQYLSNYRLEKAKHMLEQDYDKITEIAEKCGYANSNYFAKVFKEAMNMTPMEYRRRMGGQDV